MRYSRRKFVATTALACAAGAQACGDSKPGGGSPPAQAPAAAPAAGAASAAAAAASSFSATIRVRGMFALAANDDFTKATVLLPEVLRTPYRTSPKIKQHLPVLRIHRLFVDGAANCTKDPFDPAMCVWPLNDTTVTLKRSAPGHGVRRAATAATDCPGDDDAAWRDPRWLADLGQVLGSKDKAKVPADYLTGTFQAKPVACRFELSDGAVGCLPPSVKTYRYGRYKFSASSKHQQPLTDALEFVTDAAAGLSIVLTPETGAATEIALTAPAGYAGPVPVFVENLTMPGKMAHIDHFVVLYVLANYLETPPVPTDPALCLDIDSPYARGFKPLAVKPQDKQHGGADFDFPVYCPPARIYFS